LLKLGQSPGCTIAYESNQSRHAFEAILIEFGVTGVLADLAEDVDKSSENSLVDGRQALSSSDDDSHCA